MSELASNNSENPQQKDYFSSFLERPPHNNIILYPGVDPETRTILPAQSIAPGFEKVTQGKKERTKKQKTVFRPTFPKYIKKEGIQIDLYPHILLLESERLIKDLDEANQDFDNHTAEFFDLRERIRSHKAYNQRFESEKNSDYVPNPYFGEITTKFNELYKKGIEIPEIKEKIEQEQIKNRPVRKEVKILNEENIWYQIMWSEWESEKGVIEYNAKLQGWEISILSQQ